MSLGEQAKQTLKAYVPEIEKRLAAFFAVEIEKNFGFNARQKELVKEMLLHAKEHNLRQSKRVRGSFVNYSYLLSEKQMTDKVWQAAMGVELVHTGLLMHDDFMDQDEIRRFGPTTHKFFENKFKDAHLGEALAVTLGDVAIFMGIKLLADCGNADASDQLLRGIIMTGYGQAFDVALEALLDWSEDDVIALHKAKTAVYTFENPLLIGAHLGGITDNTALDLLHEYAMDAGVAFQLQDDILGVFGTPEVTGKSADSDLKQKKRTLLVLKAGKVFDKKIIEESGSHEYSKKLAKEYAQKAEKTASKLRKISSLNTDAIDYLEGIANYMVERQV